MSSLQIWSRPLMIPRLSYCVDAGTLSADPSIAASSTTMSASTSSASGSIPLSTVYLTTRTSETVMSSIQISATTTTESISTTPPLITGASTPSLFTFANRPSETQEPFQHLISVNSYAGNCIEAVQMLLWFATYNLFTALVGLALGSHRIRKRTSDMFRTSKSKKQVIRISSFTSAIVGSLVLQVSASIGTAYILRTEAQTTSVGYLLAVWVARPLATPLVIWLTMVNPPEYILQMLEITLVDTIYSFLSLYVFGLVAHSLNKSPESSYPHIGQVARAGAALGIFALLLTIALLVWLLMSKWPWRWFNTERILNNAIWHKLQTSRGFKRAVVCVFIVHSIRFVASYLLWTGLLELNEGAFCPHYRTLFEIMALWLGVPIIDNIWRAWAAGG